MSTLINCFPCLFFTCLFHLTCKPTRKICLCTDIQWKEVYAGTRTSRSREYNASRIAKTIRVPFLKCRARNVENYTCVINYAIIARGLRHGVTSSFFHYTLPHGYEIKRRLPRLVSTWSLRSPRFHNLQTMIFYTPPRACTYIYIYVAILKLLRGGRFRELSNETLRWI